MDFAAQLLKLFLEGAHQRHTEEKRDLVAEGDTLLVPAQLMEQTRQVILRRREERFLTDGALQPLHRAGRVAEPLADFAQFVSHVAVIGQVFQRLQVRSLGVFPLLQLH